MSTLSKKAIAEQARAIVSSSSLTEAYKKTHPNCSEKTAKSNCHLAMKNPAVVKKVEELIAQMTPVEITKDLIVKMYRIILEKYLAGEESGATFVRALENLQKLVPEFIDRKEINSYQHMTEDELDNAIKNKYTRLGLN